MITTKQYKDILLHETKDDNVNYGNPRYEVARMGSD
jgi:hypothetical protein